VEKNETGALLKTEKGVLKLEVFGPKIIRVAYSESGFIPTNSFAVVGTPEKTSWSLDETPDSVELKTEALRAVVSKKTGQIIFYDQATGKVLLAEMEKGGKSMTPTEIAGNKTWICRQEFALDPKEALYGLGQHQDKGFNYRGRKLTMDQDNPVLEALGDTAVPLLVSSRGYGILWDNPALAEVDTTGGGSTVIPSECLLDGDGYPGGLVASYFTGENFEKKIREQIDPVINFDWKKGAPEGLPNDYFSIRWEGAIKAPTSGKYLLRITSDDGVRVWIDGKLLIDSWISRATASDAISVDFEEGSTHQIKVEYFDRLADACIRLEWVAPGEEHLSWISEAGRAIDYYFILGPNLDQVVQGYRQLTGGVPMFGKWVWGYWQSKERYQTQQELIDVVKRYRSEKIPIDGIVQDWHYWPDLDQKTLEGGWGSHEFNKQRFPNFPRAVEKIHKENVHVLISVWPWFQRNDEGEGIENLKALDEIGAIFPIPGNTWAGNMSWYDPYTEKAQKLYWSQVSDKILSTGIDAFWLDSTEPVAGGDQGAIRELNTLAGPGCEVVNAYPLVQCESVYKGQRAETSDKRVFILTRSAYAGLQRNAAIVWTGDIRGTWKIFARQIPVGLNFCLSGIPYWNTDIGGFTINQFKKGPENPEYAELFTRWFQFGAFCPMFRVHGSDYAKEMWRFPEDTKKILVDFDVLRYHLLPYIYSVSWMVTDQNYTMMRPLVMDFLSDPKVYSIPDQYMFGPAIMACPVTEKGATSREVYLPKGANWFDFWTGKGYRGGKTIQADAPIDKMPLFVRAGSILPYGPEIQYATEQSDPLEIRVYRGANGAFTLYEDENDNYNYEKGVYSTIPFRWDEASKTLLIGARSGSFPGMKKARTFRIVFVDAKHGGGISNTRKVDKSVTYTGSKLIIPLPKK
jgi:alpha-D-xyloside xylohydrolase